MESRAKIAKNVLAIYGEGFCSNIYVLLDGRKAMLIDSGSGSTIPMLDALIVSGVEIEKAILTHGHADHITGMSYISAEGFLHEKDLENIRALNSFAGDYTQPNNISPLGEIAKGGKIAFGGFSLRIIETPGHTPGSVCIFDEGSGLLFSGDTLFSGGDVGRTDLPLGDESRLADSLRALRKVPWKKLCPGHGPAGESP